MPISRGTGPRAEFLGLLMPTDGIHWETAACPLCGCTDDREFFLAPGDDGLPYRLGQCLACGMVFTNPRPDESSIAQFYPPDYSPYQPPKKKRGKLPRGEKTLSDRIPVRPGGLFLDYGCGSGRFAARMRDRGWNAMGMDFSPHAVAAARTNFGLNALHGTLPHPAIESESLDAITLRAVLEHIHDPRALLGAVHAALRPGGWMYLSVPNIASWGFRKFGGSWFQLDVPRHLSHFTLDSLRRIVEDRGFAVEALTTVGHTKRMGCSAERAAKVQSQWWVRACRVHLIRSALTLWTQWTNQADDLALLARKPLTASVPLRKAA